MNKISVLIVDDSAVVRQVVSGIISEQPDMTVLAAVQDPIFAMDRMKKQWPDVVLLDVEMPRMDGITFLRKIMADRPTPVVICSTLTEKGAQTTIEAMAAGAVATITKAKIGLKDFLQDAAGSLLDTLRAAARANMRGFRASAPTAPRTGAQQPVKDASAMLPPRPEGAMTCTTDRVVALGTSTGGTQALDVVLPALPIEAPGIVIVQHMPEHFTAALAQRLNGICRIEVREAANNDRVGPGRALIAPGGKHMMLKRSGAQYFVEVRDGPLVNRHKPCVDVLFRSVATVAGRNAMGILLTGMGADGAVGLLEMRQAGAYTVAQDEETSIVFGMPKEAIKRGAAEQVLPLQHVASAIMRYGGR